MGGTIMISRNTRPTIFVVLSLLAALAFSTIAAGAPLYTITVKVVGAGSVQLNPSYPGNTGYQKNNIVTVTALPAQGWTFDKWSGALSGSQSPTKLRIGGNATITATFIYPTSGGGTDRPPLPASKMIVGYFAQWSI